MSEDKVILVTDKQTGDIRGFKHIPFDIAEQVADHVRYEVKTVRAHVIMGLLITGILN
jgi:hypothetical protein